jgi:Fuc2NAc and GlcNAc transferase
VQAESVLIILTGVAALLASAILTGLARRQALRRGVLDLPNDRSSHKTATPRGGGIAIVLVVTAAAIWMASFRAVDTGLMVALVAGGLPVALIGYIDDRRSVSARNRILVHTAAAILAVVALGGLPPLQVGARVVNLGPAGHVLAVVGIVWTLNLFNFMDGIDGIAAAETAIIAATGVALLTLPPHLTLLGIALSGACLGFLLWNWPPARVFMGDVGSGYLGYVLAVLALAAVRASAVAVWVWLIMGGAFFADATVTVIRRALHGARIYEAHRSHAYQWLARKWGSHRRVTLAFIAVDLLWLLPCAAVAATRPALAAWMVLIALAPLGVLVLVSGGGRREVS